MRRDFEREIIPMARHFGMALALFDIVGGGKFQTAKTLEERKKTGESLRSMLDDGGQSESEKEVKRLLRLHLSMVSSR